MMSFDPWSVAWPWLAVYDDAEVRSVSQLVPPTGLTFVGRLDGSKMTDSYGVLEQFNDAFRFPVYFGWNWDALADCLRDLAWLPADRYLVVIENVGSVLRTEQEELEILLGILKESSRSWANPLGKLDGNGIPFKVLLTAAADEVETLEGVLAPHL